MRPHLYNPHQLLPRIGHPAPAFEASSNKGFIRLSDYAGKWLILFSYPADFTPICSAEIKGFAQLYASFQALNCELLGISIDTVYDHIHWIKSLEQSGCTPIAFPILSDRNLEVSSKYGLLPNENAEEASRSVYMIDPKQQVRAIIHYPATTGRNTEEILRLLQALQIADAEKAMTPVNWNPGEPIILPHSYSTHKLSK